MTYPEAVNEILELVNAAWVAGSTTLLGSAAELRFASLETQGLPDENAYWGRVTARQIESHQDTLGNASGGRRFERNGIVVVQIFAPISLGSQAWTNLHTLGRVASNSMEAQTTPGGVWFRDVTTTELDPESPWIRINVTSTFTFDEVK